MSKTMFASNTLRPTAKVLLLWMCVLSDNRPSSRFDLGFPVSSTPHLLQGFSCPVGSVYLVHHLHPLQLDFFYTKIMAGLCWFTQFLFLIFLAFVHPSESGRFKGKIFVFGVCEVSCFDQILELSVKQV